MNRISHRPSCASARSSRVGPRWVALVGALRMIGCADAAAPGGPQHRHAPECQAPPGVSDRPRSIEQTVELVNALPKPLTLPCFVEALARPLQLHSTLSEFSAQPAVGAGSPRIFVYNDPLLMSVAVKGLGAPLLELGEERADFRSLKGELRFPIDAPLAGSQPFEHALFMEGLTGCAFCHADEAPEPSIHDAPAFVSQALRPRPEQHVPLAAVKAEWAACDRALEPDRCALFEALFSWGDTVEWDFPAAMPTFGG